MSEITANRTAAADDQSTQTVLPMPERVSYSPGVRSLVECVYISVVCTPCECVRVALAEEPKEEQINCPACGRSAAWTLLARGATVRPLPFYQRMRLGEDQERRSKIPWSGLRKLTDSGTNQQEEQSTQRGIQGQGN